MAIPNREQHQNSARSPLNGAIDDNDTTLVVDDGSLFPSTGNFRLMIEEEILICTARSTNTLTVVRGQEGTTGAAHADDIDVQLIYTAGSLPRLAQDYLGLWGYSSRLPNGVFNDTAAARLVASDFTWVNQGSASRSDGTSGNIYLRIPTDSAATNLRMLSRTPGVATFAYVASVRMFAMGDSGFSAIAGIGLRESGTNKVITIGMGGSSAAYNFVASLKKWSASATISSSTDPPLCLCGDEVYLRVELTSTHVNFKFSLDGIEWIQILSETKGTHFTTAPDEVVFFAVNVNNSGSEMIASLDHWHKE